MDRANQNLTRTPNCICRADVMVLRTRPKLASGLLAIGGAGERDELRRTEVGAIEDVEDFDSHFEPAAVAELRPGVSFTNDRSTVRRLGPMKSPRPVLPNVPAAGRQRRPPD